MIKDYSRIRKNLLARIKNIKKHETLANIYKKELKYIELAFPPESKLSGVEKRLAYEDIQKYSDLLSSVRHAENKARKVVDTLNRKNINIKYEELAEFIEFMEHLREISGSYVYDSDKAVELFQESESLENAEENYRNWASSRKRQ